MERFTFFERARLRLVNFILSKKLFNKIVSDQEVIEKIIRKHNELVKEYNQKIQDIMYPPSKA